MVNASNLFKKAFTLIEIMVVVGIVALLAAVIGVNVRDSSAQSRDAQRQADLRNLQNAIELYKQENGRYPAACRGVDTWSGQIGTNFACPGGSREYITGLAPKYIKFLPIDEKLNGMNSGYMYIVNGAGSVYKLKAHRTVESEINLIDFEHPFKACDIRVAHNGDGSLSSASIDPEVIGFCGLRQNVGQNGLGARSYPNECNSTDEAWNMSYALWGGIATLQPQTRTTIVGLTNHEKAQALRFTTDIICR
jgi:prepilin-type N-terminal cleavage/methylation domain-containing protein